MLSEPCMLVLVVLVIGTKADVGNTPKPTITSTTDAPSKGDVFNATCSCPLHSSGAMLSLFNECDDCGMAMIGRWPGQKDAGFSDAGKFGEKFSTREANNGLTIDLSVKLTCASTIKYECVCDYSKAGTAAPAIVNVKKYLNVDGCK